MISACADMARLGVIQGVLGGVDCETRTLAQAGYSALTSSSSVFQYAITALLTIYVAAAGYRMLFARRGARLLDAPGMALSIGLVLALITSWPAFQTLVFNLVADGPGELASVIAHPLQADSSLASDPVASLQTVYDELGSIGTALGKSAGHETTYASPAASAADSLSLASGVLFLSTVGVLAATMIAIGVLTAAGPIFISCFLLPATRGLFVGWLRAVVAAALVTLVTWVLIVSELHLLQPWLEALEEQQRAGTIEPDTAKSLAAFVFVFGGGELALTLGALVVAVGFRLPTRAVNDARSDDRVDVHAARAPAAPPTGAQRLALNLQREEARMVARRLDVMPPQRQQPQRIAATAGGLAPVSGTPQRRPKVGARRPGVAR